ncbi:MAG: HD domain-containing protein [Candidatus Magasanikbacteria bacterium]|nr:HD domain-containing protein [Candidatus Magasanikbacteria bacterium]
MNINKILKIIYRVSKDKKTEVYAVGGYVRDKVLKKKSIKDIDFVVIGSGLEFARFFDIKMKDSYGFKKDEEGTLIEFPDFDTARYVISNETKENKNIEIEFAGARSEVYKKGSRKPKVSPANLENDLSRRDFTINAIAQKVIATGLSKKKIDPFNGLEDIKNKLIKTPLDPSLTFIDDPLRMLRAARFSAQLKFDIERNTYESMKKNSRKLKNISAERIQEELFKLLSAETPSVGLWVLYNTRLLHVFLPEIANLYGVEDVYGTSHKNNLSHTFKVVDKVAKLSGNTLLRYAALMHDVGKPGTKKFVKGRGWTFDMHEHLGRKLVRKIGKRLRMSRSDTEYVAKLVRWHQQPIALMDEGVTDSAVRRLIVNLEDDLDDLLILCRSDITTGNPKKLKKRLKNYDYLEKRIGEVIEKDKLRAFQSPVRGEEIMKVCGLKPGPTVGKIKKAIEEAILDGRIPNEHEEAYEYFLSIKENFLDKAKDWEKIKK